MRRGKLSAQRKRGSAMLEFVLSAVPLMFAWIDAVEMARGMWQYHQLQYAVKQTALYASMHGASCASPNSCLVNVSKVVTIFNRNAAALPMNQVKLQLTSKSGTVTCAVVSTCSSNGSWNSQWPPSGDNAIGSDIKIRADYTFHTALAMQIPGLGMVAFGSSAGPGVFNFPGYSHMQIVF